MTVKRLIFILLILTITCVSGFAGNDAYAEESVSFQRVYDNLNLKKNTKFFVKEYWKSVEGRLMVSSGIVRDVKGGRGKATVFAANKSRATIRGYNVELIVYDTLKAAKLRKNQKIKFKGYLHDYHSGKKGGVVITLREAEIY